MNLSIQRTVVASIAVIGLLAVTSYFLLSQDLANLAPTDTQKAAEIAGHSEEVPNSPNGVAESEKRETIAPGQLTPDASRRAVDSAAVGQREECRVRGSIVENGKSVRGVLVEFRLSDEVSKKLASTTSGEDGRFRFDEIPPGTDFEIYASEGTDAFARREVPRLAPGADIEVGPLELEHGAAIAGVVVDPSGSPLAGSRVSVSDLNVETNSDREGRFEFHRLPAGHHDLHAVSRGLSDRQGLALDLAPGESKLDLRIEMVAATLVRGRVVDEARRPIEGADSTAFARTREGGEEARDFTTSAADGSFVFERLATRECRISTIATGYEEASTQLSSKPENPRSGDESETIEIVLKRGRRIHGRCVDAGSKAAVPIDSVELRMIDGMDAERPWPRAAKARIEPDGSFELVVGTVSSDVRARVRCRAANRAPAMSDPFALAPIEEAEEPVEVTIEFAAPDALEVVVSDQSTHDPIEAARIAVFGPAAGLERPFSGADAALATASTPSDGIAHFSNLGGGVRRIEVRASGYAPAVLEVTIVPGTEVRASVELVVGGAIEAIVKDPLGKPVEGIGVYAQLLEGYDVNGFTDAKGRVRLENLVPGRYAVHAERSDENVGSPLSVRAPGLPNDGEFRHVVTNGAVTTVALVVDPRECGSLEGTVLVDGAPAGAAVLLARPIDGGADSGFVQVLRTTSDALGRFLFTRLPPRTYFLTVVVADSTEYAGTEVAIAPLARESTAIAIETATVHGRIEDPAKPAPQTLVIVRYAPQDPRHAMTHYTWASAFVGSDGTFELKRIQVGRNEIVLRRKGAAESIRPIDVPTGGVNDLVIARPF